MLRLVSNQEIATALSAMKLLKETLASPMQGVGSNAARELRELTGRMKIADCAIASLRDRYDPQAKSLVAEYDRISATAGDRARRLAARAEYKGPRRGAMTVKEKTTFIHEHGAEEFEKLPW
jgi:hypothetical protein